MNNLRAVRLLLKPYLGAIVCVNNAANLLIIVNERARKLEICILTSLKPKPATPLE